MTLNELKILANDAELKAAKLNRLARGIEAIDTAIEDLQYLRKNAGMMLFAGRSGKIGEQEILKEVRINDIAGCVKVPELMIELATTKRAELEEEAELLRG